MVQVSALLQERTSTYTRTLTHALHSFGRYLTTVTTLTCSSLAPQYKTCTAGTIRKHMHYVYNIHTYAHDWHKHNPQTHTQVRQSHVEVEKWGKKGKIYLLLFRV